MTLKVLSIFEQWPSATVGTGLLRSGAATIAGYRDGELAILVRRWVGDGSRWLSRWPTEEADNGPVPTMFFAEGSDPRRARVFFEQRGVDGEDHLVSTVELSTGDTPHWLEELPGGPEGSVIEAMANVVAKAWAASTPDALPEGEVIALPGPRLAGVHDDLAQRSWHLAHLGRTLRALEGSPFRDSDGDVVRARCASIFDGGSPVSAPGFVLWGDGDVRLWRSGEHPLLDPPVLRNQRRPEEQLLMEHLEHEAALPPTGSDGDPHT